MNQVFADTFYWIALLNPGDDWHNEVLRYIKQNQNITIITTEGVLDEVLNYASTRGSWMRRKALSLCIRISQDPKMTIIAHDHSSAFRLKGLALYKQRPDKQYSITDCISMVVMTEMNIQCALTHDKHFTQEGFEIEFRDEDKVL